MNEEKIVVSLGGSLIIPEEIDVEFLRDLKSLITEEVKKGKKFFFITGGGKICRKYQKAAQDLSSPSNADLDWIGVASLNLNAELVRVVFGDLANKKNIYNPSHPIDFEYPVVVCGADDIGASTDRGAIWAAKSIGAKKVVNLSNIDYVYDADPRLNPGAKKIESISWSEYRKLIPSEWNPGLNTPFDPLASKEADESNIEVAIMNGKPIENFSNYLKGEKFLGTIIS